MSHSPQRTVETRRVPECHSTRPPIGPPSKPGNGSKHFRRLLRQGLLVVLCTAAVTGLSGGAIGLLPSAYEAEARLLVDAPPPHDFFDRQAQDIARQVVAELHLDQDADFNPALRPPGWWPPPPLPRFATWFHTQTGLAIPGLTENSISAPPPAEDRTLDGFWSHVDISLLGRSSRILSIRARSRDPRQAAAIANAVAQHHPVGGMPLSTAFASTDPVFPPTTLILVLGGLGGLVLGVFAAQSAGGARRTFRRADDIEAATNLPVMAVIPQLKNGSAAMAHVLRDPLSSYSESLRQLYVSLQQTDWTNPPKVIGVGSAVPAEGRSTLAASIGRLLAGEGKRVLLIDCDWRNPDLHRLFRLSNETGLSSLLRDGQIAWDDVIHSDALSGLDIITVGRETRLTVPMLMSDRMRKILEDFAKSYELILLDMPPVLMANEVLLLSRLVDKIIFAIRWRQTRRKMSLGAIERIQNSQGDVAGIVLTCVDPVRYRKDQGRRPPSSLRGTPRMSRRPF